MDEFIQINGRLRPFVMIALIATLFVTTIVCLTMGRYPLLFGDVLHGFYSRIAGHTIDATTYSVLFNLRLPRTVLAMVLGAGLACAGAAFQSLFANPLATPDTLGVTAGASVGAVLALLADGGMFTVQMTALIFGIASVMMTVSFARIRGRSSILMLVLSGVIISSVFNAIISIIKYTCDPINKLPQITYWLMGSLSGASYKSLAFGMPFIVAGVAMITALRWRLNILTLSEDEAHAAGINVQRTRIAIVIASTMVTASCVSMCGQVGWVGLLVPHCARMICGSNNRFVIPLSIILGGIFVVIIDTLARTLTASEIPVSVLTAVFGAPFFILLLRKTGGNWE